jgi:tripartite-type tricarboxylate transporter receptor subunit TctC
MLRRAVAIGLPLLLAALIPGAPAQAQGTYPTKTIRLLIPFPAGGVNDVLARIVSDKLQAKWGQPIVIENKTGAGGNIGADLAYNAPADGYTLMISPPGPLSINQTLYKRLTYKPDEFVPITMIGSVPNIVVVRKELPVNTLAELTEYVKKNPGKVVFGSQGNGATPHLNGNLYMTLTGTNMVHVSYRGETLVLQDMLGGHVDIFFGNVSSALSLWRDGKIKVLAVLDKTRNANMPDVPTTAEAGMPQLVSVGWFAMVGPPKLPANLRDDIAAAVNEALKLPDVQQKFRAISVEPIGGSPAQLAAFIKDESQRWGEVIRKTGVTVD